MWTTTVFSLLLGATCNVVIDAHNAFSPNQFHVTEDPAPGFSPNLGNGFIGYDVGCPCGDETSSAGNVFLAGTYSGQGSIDPSKRAMIPQHFSVYVTNGTLDNDPLSLLQHEWVAELDIERGLFTNTSTFYAFDGDKPPSEEQNVCSISLTWLVHREIKDMVALHITTTAGPAMVSSSCLIQIQTCAGEPTDLVTLVDSNAEIEVYQTTTPEVPNGDIHTIFTSHDSVPPTFAVHGSLEELTQNDYLYLSFFQSSAWITSIPFAEASHLNVAFDVIAKFDLFQQTISARKKLITWSDLLSSHVDAWRVLWDSGIEVGGNDTIAASINASLYYIHAAVDSQAPWSISPGGLSKNSYSGHVFWDCETWVLPALAPFYPDVVLSFEEYRRQRLPAALARARKRGFSDAAAMMPWESAYTGMDVTPVGNYEGSFEIHVTADIPLAMRSVYYWTGNETWLKEEVWPVIVACAQYLAERASCLDASCEQYSYMNVQPPDEKAGIVNASVYTNAAAADILSWVASRNSEYAEWSDIADKLIIPLSATLYSEGVVHPEYEGYAGEAINQADAVLLQFPLQFSMDDTVAFNDLQYYAALTSVPGETKGYYTGDSSYSIAYMMLERKGFQDTVTHTNLQDLADDQFQQAFEHIDVSSFFVWKEKVDGGHLNFLTGAGGFLQNCVYGYAGVVVDETGLMLDSPALPPGGVSDMKLRGVHYRESVLNVWWNSSFFEIQLEEGELDVYSQSSSQEWKFVTTLTTANNQLVVPIVSKVKLVG